LIENFKSWQGTSQLGPFDNFSCIIGPNGSGKSNVMDAISFVFGQQAYDLRGRKAQDLIYKSPLSDETSAPDSASVELVYTELENGTEHSFKRTIRRTSSTITHYVDGKRVTAQQYHDELKTIGVDSKSPNFLVYQGDVELIAQKMASN